MYISLYRKYRPRDFSEVVGQDVVCKTLQNAISLNRLSHAYLFSGPRGTGKTTMARILAKCLNCENGPTETPCNTCSLCQRIQEGHCLDIIEIDAASNSGIDNIRDLREKIKFSPTEARHKIYIIDEVHQLSTDAKDAMLKTLEEPPENTFFILATTEPHKLAPTIHSRCQHFEFKRISPQDIQSQLKSVAKKEKIQSDEKTLSLISTAADGALRDALSIMDQMIALCGKTLVHDEVVKALGITEHESVVQLMSAMADFDAKQCLLVVENLSQEGKDLHQVLKNLLEGFRTLLLCKVLGSSHPLTALTKETQKDFESLSARYDVQQLFHTLNVLSLADFQMKKEMHPRILFEMAVIRLTQKNNVMPPQEESETAPREADRLTEKKKDTVKTPGKSAPAVTHTAAPLKEKEPEARPETTAETPGDETETDLYLIQKHWKKIMSEMERKKRSVYSLVIHSSPLKCTPNELTLAFTKENDFSRAMADKYKDFVEKTVLEVTHKNYSVRMVTAEDSGDEQKPKGKVQPFSARAAAAPETQEQDGDIMQDILQTFEGSAIVKETT